MDSFILTCDNVADYAIEKNLIKEKDIVDFDIEIIDISRKNNNFILNLKNQKSLFFKQPNHTEMYDFNFIAQEFLLYALTQTERNFALLSNFIPRCIYYDKSNSILVTEFLQGKPSLAECILSRLNKYELFNKLGKIMATYHSINPMQVIGYNHCFTKKLPSTFFIVKPDPQILYDLSPTGLNYFNIIQSHHEFVDYIENSVGLWQGDSLIHSDIRWSNILIADEDEHIVSQVKIIDWELMSVGDPAWDIGCLFQEILRVWIDSVHIAQESIIIDNLQASSELLTCLQQYIRHFWDSYVESSNFNEEESKATLSRSIKYCAIRLLHAIYEYSSIQPELMNKDIITMQLSLNIFRQPKEAINYLLGID